MAIDLGTTIVGRPTDDLVALTSEGFAGTCGSTAAPTGPGGRPAHPTGRRGDATWPAVVAELGPDRGFDGRGRPPPLPVGAGLSSSAALEVAVALALGADQAPHPLDPIGLAQACQRAEHRASGVPCGLMDQLTSVGRREGHALLVDFRSLAVEPVPVPDVGRRRGGALGPAPAAGRLRLRRAAPPGRGGRAPDRSAARRHPGRSGRASATRTVRARARHVVTENARVRAFADALRGDDPVTAGAVMAESHASNRDDFEASTPVVDALVAAPGRRTGVLRGAPGGWRLRRLRGGPDRARRCWTRVGRSWPPPARRSPRAEPGPTAPARLRLAP